MPKEPEEVDDFEDYPTASISITKYERKITSGSWEFIFSKPRTRHGNPVVKHAKFTGLN